MDIVESLEISTFTKYGRVTTMLIIAVRTTFTAMATHNVPVLQERRTWVASRIETVKL